MWQSLGCVSTSYLSETCHRVDNPPILLPVRDEHTNIQPNDGGCQEWRWGSAPGGDSTKHSTLFSNFYPLQLFLIMNNISLHLESMTFSKQRLVALLAATSVTRLAAAYLLPRATVSVPDASSCLPDSGLTALSGCLAMSSYAEKCKALSTTKSIIDCWCQQEMLSDIYSYAGSLLFFRRYPVKWIILTYDYRCEGDIELCIGSHWTDNLFESLISEWHSSCTYLLTSLTFTPSSLPLPTLTSSYDVGVCISLSLSCNRADYETSLCSHSYLPRQTVPYLSCVCAEPIYTLFSQCQYDSNVSCLHTSAAKSNILGWSFCSYFRPGAVSYFLRLQLPI